ncbi:hypothetical protein MKW94_026197 [Papaver nudicaule]|uniref:Non-specific lipid-transfer protein n=1 Tax=Papaver nudicaule TaxID=74823 RepID=A0AA41VKZ6_PAPNU|nr:hypothetical protein [Papaver nudicaule]
MATSGVKAVCTVMLMCMLISAPYMAEALTCGQVTSNLAPCISYLTKKGALVPGCCSGVKTLNGAAKTTPNRKTACGCLKGAINSFKGIDLNLVAGLPGKCGVSIPYKIAPSTDCSKVM